MFNIASLIIGFPGETDDTVEQTQAFIEDSGLQYYFIQPFYYLHHTPVHKNAEKYGLTFPLLADADHEVAEKYGVWQQKSRYGRNYMGIVRTTYLIGPDGKVVRRWDNVKVDGHAEEVLDATKAI